MQLYTFAEVGDEGRDFYCDTEEVDLAGTINFLAEETRDDGCYLLMEIYNDDGISYFASEVTYFSDADITVVHFFDSANLTKDEFLNYVNQTLNTIEEK